MMTSGTPGGQVNAFMHDTALQHATTMVNVSFVVAHMLLSARCYLHMYEYGLLSTSHSVCKLFVMSSLIHDCVLCSCPDDDEVTSPFRPLVHDCIVIYLGHYSHTSPSADPGMLMSCCKPGFYLYRPSPFFSHGQHGMWCSVSILRCHCFYQMKDLSYGQISCHASSMLYSYKLCLMSPTQHQCQIPLQDTFVPVLHQHSTCCAACKKALCRFNATQLMLLL